MGAAASQCRRTQVACEKQHSECVKRQPVVGTIVETVDVCDELFRTNDIVVFRVQNAEKKKHYVLSHGERQATFHSTVALVESYVAEVRAGLSESYTAVAVTNPSGMHLTHLSMWSTPNEHHDDKSKEKLTNLIHSFSF